LVTNTLAKDKEISDRWRGFCRVADLPPSQQPRPSVKSLTRWSLGSRSLSKTVASLLRLEGGLVQQEEAAALGSQRAAAVCRDRHIAWPRRATWCCRPNRWALTEMAAIAERFFTDRWSSTPRAAGKGAGRILASDHAVAHPYVADELSGQKPRDVMTLAHEPATACTRCWRQEWSADGADPLNAGGDRQCVREMLTFKRLLSQTKNQKQRRRCWPARSKT